MRSRAEIVRKEIGNLSDLSTLSDVAGKVLTMVEDPSSLSSSRTLADIISKDQVLTSRILKLVNSPYYGFPQRVATLTSAITILGVNVVRGLVLGVSVFDTMNKAILGLWEHSFCASIIAGFLAKKIGLKNAEETSVAALLHDIGKVVVFQQYPKDFAEIVRLAKEEQLSIVEAEESVLGINHAEIGGIVLNSWSLPSSLCEAVQYHHSPFVSKTYISVAHVVHLSNILATAMGVGFSGQDFVSLVHRDTYSVLKISDVDIHGVLNKTLAEVESNEDVF